jgi:hypothetical protein
MPQVREALDRLLAEIMPGREENVPQRLKPDAFCDPYGTAEAVPLQTSEFFRKLF